MPHYSGHSAQAELAAGFRLRRRPPEICHFLYADRDFWLSGRSGAGRRGAIVCTYHQERGHLDRFVPDKRCLGTADAIVAVARAQAEMLSEFVERERVFWVPLGVDTDFYRPIDRPPRDSRRLLLVGDHLRDFETLSALASLLAEKDPTIEIETVTSPPRRDLLCQLANVNARTEISDGELLEAYQAADLLLLPLIDSTANNALLEGLSCGLPAVVSDVGGVRDYVDSTCASLVRAGDVHGMCRAVLGLLDDRELRLRMGTACRARALSFRWSLIADRHIEIYRSALARRSATRRGRATRAVGSDDPVGLR